MKRVRARQSAPRTGRGRSCPRSGFQVRTTNTSRKKRGNAHELCADDEQRCEQVRGSPRSLGMLREHRLPVEIGLLTTVRDLEPEMLVGVMRDVEEAVPSVG